MKRCFRQPALLAALLIASLCFSACSAPIAPRPSSSPASERPASEAASAAPADSAAAEAGSAGAWPTAAPADPAHPAGQAETVTAGVTDDNEQWQAYLNYRTRQRHLWVNHRDVSERYLIQVIDQQSAPVHDATVTVYAGDEEFFVGRTDAGGRLYFHPRALDQRYGTQQASDFRLVVSKGYMAESRNFARYGAEQWTVRLAAPLYNDRVRLDLLFLIDATGSMGDEIDKLKVSMAEIANQIGQLPEQPHVRYGLVAYRDRGDLFVTRHADFTPDLGEFQRNLAAVRADGGGDTPESLNEALDVAINRLSWRTTEATVRLVILVADAPPHLDYGETYTYDVAMIDAVARGIKIFPVGASNLDQDGEYVFRQLAQFTGGKFVFLTYKEGSDPSSGPGTETEHDVENYSVDTLDRLVVRLVREELARLATPVALQQQPSPIAPPAPTPTMTPQLRSPIHCLIELNARASDCDPYFPITWEVRQDQVIALVSIALAEQDIERVRFELVYDSEPLGSLVELRDGLFNGQDDVDLRVQGGDLIVYGNDLAIRGGNGVPLPYSLPDAVRSGESLSLEISAGRLGVNSPRRIDVLNSPALFAFNRTPAYSTTDHALVAVFVRSGQAQQWYWGTGLSTIVITLYPAE